MVSPNSRSVPAGTGTLPLRPAPPLETCGGANSTRFSLTRPAKSSTCSTVSRASSASLIFRPSPRPLEAPLTAQLGLSEAEADATCEHQRNRAGEAVLLGSTVGAGEHLLRDSISDTLCDERMDRFQTRVGFGGEKEK